MTQAMTEFVCGIYQQRAEEAAFLWTLRDAYAVRPHFSLFDLTNLDSRLDAHLDGLRVAGDDGWEICKTAIDQGPGGLSWIGDSFKLLFLFETDWGRLTLSQRLELCQFLGMVYEKLTNSTSQLVIVELLGKYLATAYSLQMLDRLSKASNDVARAYVAYGYKCLVLNAAEQELKKKALARLTAMATDSSEIVRQEVAAAIADVS
jgi:hypothetical protein